jgi:flagellar basal body-associated protein FliL
LVPALCYAVMEFLVIPKLKASGGGSEHAPAPSHGSAKKDSHGGSAEAGNTVDFEPIVVNLAGSGNSRYLRAKFSIICPDSKLKDKIDENKIPLKDAAIRVLSTQSLDALDGVNGQEIVRKGLVKRFNDILGAESIEEIFFSEYLVQ